MVDSVNSSWWKGHRGEWYVIIQIGIFALVIFGPRTISDLHPWTSPYAQTCSIIGVALLLTGAALILAGFLKLGKNLTPLPYPKEHAALIETGPYRIVRHPIYSGGIIMAFGWALWINGWLTIVYAAILLIFLDIKSRREEQWLKDKFADYAQYQERVRKLIPFLY